MKRKTYIKVKINDTPETKSKTQTQKVSRLYALAEKLKVKIGG